MTWNILPEKYNYSINGMMRGKPVPDEADVTLLHYRSRIILAEAGLKDLPEQFLADQIGTSRVRWVFKVPPPPGVALVGPEGFCPICRLSRLRPRPTPRRRSLAPTRPRRGWRR